MTGLYRHLTALLAMAGGGLVFVSATPPAWYGYEPTDSYVFDPNLFSPLWVERELMSVLALLGTIGILVGLAAIVYRDWGESRLLGASGSLTILGGVAMLAGIYGPNLLGPSNTTASITTGLVAFVMMLWGGLLLFFGIPLFAYATIRLERQVFGWSFLGFVPIGILLGYLSPEGVVGLVSSIPWLVMGVIIGRELLHDRKSSSVSSNS